MSMFIKAHKRWLLPVILAAILVPLALVAVAALDFSALPPQEITLVTRDSTFRLAGRPDEPNPTLELQRGRPVRLILRNEEPGKALHCFTLGGLGVKTARNLATGESEELNFTPGQTGKFIYACLLHPSMAGTIIVK